MQPPRPPYQPPQYGTGQYPTNAAPQDYLNRAVQAEIASGWRVESYIPGQVVLVRGGDVNHVLHLILTLITVGLWVIVWGVTAEINRKRRLIISIGPDGSLTRVRA